MGLDGVELIMELEDTFQLQIANAEAESFRTVGDIHKLIFKKLQRPDGITGCLSAHAFYKLRRALTDSMGRNHSIVRRVAPLAQLLPRDNRGVDLNRLATASGLTMPELRRPLGLDIAIILSAWAAGLAAGAAIGLHFSWPLALLAFVVAILVAIHLLGIATRRWICEVRKATTFGDFVNRVRDLNFSRLTESSKRFQEKEVWNTIVALTAETLGVQPQDIKPESRLVEDLNIG